MHFEEELARVLPPDIPHRRHLITKAAQHLVLIQQANEFMNLTRISGPRDAAIKHVFDSVAPWHHFKDATRVLDAGTGAGFPGIPLALVLPEVQFMLSESTGKKARFVEAAVESLGLLNVKVTAERAETQALQQRPDIITARAVAPLHKLLDLFDKSIRLGTQLLLYKGPDAETELAELKRRRIKAQVVERYELPDGLGSRILLSITKGTV